MSVDRLTSRSEVSAQNIEIARTGIDALNRGDIEALLALCDPGIELMPSLVGGIEGTSFHGREGYREWFEQQNETYDEVSFELHETRAVGDQVLILYTTRVRGAQSGIELESPGAAVLTIRDGLVTRQVGYQSQVEALEAVGLVG